MAYFGPALDQLLGGSGLKTTTLVWEYFIPTKFLKNSSISFLGKADLTGTPLVTAATGWRLVWEQSLTNR